MPRRAVYVKLACDHDTVLTQGEQFRWEKDNTELINCPWCFKNQAVIEVKVQTFSGPVCVYCYNGQHDHCVFIDMTWGKPIGKCTCHEQGHGDPFLMLVWAMGNPPTSTEDATVKSNIIVAASVEDRVRAAEAIKEKASA